MTARRVFATLGWSVLGGAAGLAIIVVGFCFAMTQPGFILPMLLASGVVLSFLKWPALLGVFAVILAITVTGYPDFHVSAFVCPVIAAAWLVCRGLRHGLRTLWGANRSGI